MSSEIMDSQKMQLFLNGIEPELKKQKNNDKILNYTVGDIVEKDCTSLNLALNLNSLRQEVDSTITKGVYALNDILEKETASDFAKIECLKQAVNLSKYIDSREKEQRERNTKELGLEDDLDDINFGEEA